MENNIKNNEDFLKSITGKNTGFSAPSNYFDTAEDRFSSFIFEESLPKENSFKTPDSYFENLENEIINKAFPTKETKVISLKSRFLKIIPVASAACIALFLGITYFNTINNKAEITFDSIAQLDIENWIIENSNDLTKDDFANVLNSDIVNENDFAFAELKDDAIEDYIITTDNISILNEK
ncbi:hypothetical protein FDT66_13165 [Polaribacter aestuariivivens]|uniref:Uncharacterized protein n=1 Tax=Polaribacter aestuariivivens TaxID=2304626 RepID=A0A5S3N622_9FLAO|nr:hypothetical protein [Polaribacter aestuariivivens]TMM28849.1 hypothetical protein FDT66_13165 [Polaribacter aestuariivivens]